MIQVLLPILRNFFGFDLRLALSHPFRTTFIWHKAAICPAVNLLDRVANCAMNEAMPDEIVGLSDTIDASIRPEPDILAESDDRILPEEKNLGVKTLATVYRNAFAMEISQQVRVGLARTNRPLGSIDDQDVSGPQADQVFRNVGDRGLSGLGSTGASLDLSPDLGSQYSVHRAFPDLRPYA
jgi:hypothetical protein